MTGKSARIAGFMLSLALLPFASLAQAEDWVQLFNGKDLTGWTPKIRGEKLGEDSRHTFRVENGVIKILLDGAEVASIP